MSCIRKTKSGGAHDTFFEIVKRLLEEKALVFSLEPKCSPEIPELDCVKDKNDVGNTIKHECPNITNAQIGVTSPNSRGEKLAVVKVAEWYEWKLLNSGKIQIGWEYVWYESGPPHSNVTDI